VLRWAVDTANQLIDAFDSVPSPGCEPANWTAASSPVAS